MCTSPNVDKARVVHLCAINESNQVISIEENDVLLKSVRHGHLSHINLAIKKICKVSRMYQPTVNFFKVIIIVI